MPGRQTASRTIGHVPTKGAKAPTHIIPVLAVEPNSIAAVVIRACASVNGDDVALLNLTTKLMDLEFDSLDLVEMIMTIEKELSLSVDEIKAEKFMGRLESATVGQVIVWIEAESRKRPEKCLAHGRTVCAVCDEGVN